MRSLGPHMSRALGPELEAMRRELEAHARDFGLDFYPVIFEVLDYAQMNQVAALGGIDLQVFEGEQFKVGDVTLTLTGSALSVAR